MQSPPIPSNDVNIVNRRHDVTHVQLSGQLGQWAACGDYWLELQAIHRFSQSYQERPLLGHYCLFNRAFTFKTLLKHYAKQELTPRYLNVKLGPQRKGHKGWLA